MNRIQLEDFLIVRRQDHARSPRMPGTLPEVKSDFRPDSVGRSLGELAWYLAETEGFVSHIVARGTLSAQKLPELEGPRTVAEILPAFQEVHERAVERVRGLSDEQLTAGIPVGSAGSTSVTDLLWSFMLLGMAELSAARAQ